MFRPFSTPALPAFQRDERSVLNDQLRDIEGLVHTLKVVANTQAIKTGSLGFRSSRESDAWFESNRPGGELGIILDFHMVIEHVLNTLNGTDIMKSVERVYKLKLATMNQAPLPRFLRKVAGLRFVKGDSSHFDNLDNFKDWNIPNDGIRDKL